MNAAARVAPAVARNRAAIAAVLRTWLRQPGSVLELASGSGEHGVYFCTEMPDLTWQPTDRDADALASIEAWRAQAGPANLLAPLRLDATETKWPIAQADAVVAINMTHIAPWAATLGLMAGATRVLPAGGVLFLYGPFLEAGVATAPSNLAFDASLRGRDAAWGIRSLPEISKAAADHGLELAARVAMPANNLSLVLRKI